MHAAMEDRDRVQRENAQLQQEISQLQQEKEDLAQDNTQMQQERERLQQENASIWEDYEKGAAQMKVRCLTLLSQAQPFHGNTAPPALSSAISSAVMSLGYGSGRSVRVYNPGG